LLGEGQEDRRQWVENRLQELSQVFAMEIAGFAVLDSHQHALVRLCPERVPTWSDEEVVRRWARVVLPRRPDREPLEISRPTKGVRTRFRSSTLKCRRIVRI